MILGAQHGVRTRGGFNIEIKLEGNYYRLAQLMNTFGPQVMLIASGAQRQFAEEYRDRVKKNIREGGKRFGYPGHSPAYAHYKQKHGGPASLLVWSRAMHDAIEVMKLPEGRVGVGIPRNEKREKYHDKDQNRLTISEYANVLEHGTMGGLHIPARPVFSDTFKEDMKGLKGLRIYLETSIMLGLRAQGIPVSKM